MVAKEIRISRLRIETLAKVLGAIKDGMGITDVYKATGMSISESYLRGVMRELKNHKIISMEKNKENKRKNKIFVRNTKFRDSMIYIQKYLSKRS